MRILVYPHNLGIVGNQINAIDLAGAVRALGHDVLVCARSGPLMERVEHLGLRFVPAEIPRAPRPSPKAIAELRRVGREQEVDLVHSYGENACLEAFFGPCLRDRIPLVASILSMSVARWLPPSIPLVVGTAELQETTQAARKGRVHLIEPPVDLDQDNPDLDATEFARRYGLNDGIPNVVLVSRLSAVMKLTGVEAAIEAVAGMAEATPVRLVIVGDGKARKRVEDRATAVNDRLNRRVVVLAGRLRDPRPAYAAADVVLAMGGAALRAMAMEKPVIVLGERGFARLFSPESSDRFLRAGFYGTGNGASGELGLREQLAMLLDDPGLRQDLGAFGRSVVATNFDLRSRAETLVEVYERAIREVPQRPSLLLDGLRTAASTLLLDKVRPRLKRLASGTRRAGVSGGDRAG